jgi:fluoroacetyl-CoA thioesterase
MPFEDQIGIEREETFTVEGALTTDVGETETTVLSTPGMIAMIGHNTLELVAPHLPEGKATVGFEISLKHVARALRGAECVVWTRLDDVVDGRKLRFAVEVREGDRTIGVGVHERRVIALDGAGGPK